MTITDRIEINPKVMMGKPDGVNYDLRKVFIKRGLAGQWSG